MGREKAKLEILSELLSYPTVSQKDWQSDFSTDVQVGDLVSLNSAPVSKWFLSWVKKIDKTSSRFSTRYLLESVEDGELCWWSNVGFNIYNRKRVSERPKWKWDDKQHAFFSRWFKSCKRHDSYIVLPVLPEFHDDYSVTLNVRIRFGFTNFQNPKIFDNWKKLNMKDMEKYYLECVTKNNQEKGETKCQN